jgi:hypothetical protein
LGSRLAAAVRLFRDQESRLFPKVQPWMAARLIFAIMDDRKN